MRDTANPPERDPDTNTSPHRRAQPSGAGARSRLNRARMPGMANNLIATLRTNLGSVVVRLFPDYAPKTVRNFTELAEGGREWTNPTTGATSKDRLYDGTIFHRVIAGFMIQGGDPLGTGRGRPGYQFAHEIPPDLTV